MADRARLSEATLAFGALGRPRPDRHRLDRSRFRMAVLGDFSGRAARNEIGIGPALARRRAIRLDIDTIDEVIAGFATTLVLPVGRNGDGIEVRLTGIDDLHPDALFENVNLFDGLADLKRDLGAGTSTDLVREKLVEWGRAFGRKVRPPRKVSRGNRIPASARLSDFQTLIGGKGVTPEATPVDALIARIVGPFVRAHPDPDLSTLEQAVDDALSDAMRLIQHHPEFQSVEAQWRTLDLLVRQIETGDDLDITLFDVSAEEIAADLASVEDLTDSGLHGLLAEGARDGRGNFSALIGLYAFEELPSHAELLGRIARLAAHIDAPFFAAMAPDVMDTDISARHPQVARAWDGLRAMPEAGHVALALPRFLLRRPYGARSDPVSAFAFEEFTETEGLTGMLWANPAAFVAVLLGLSFRQNGREMGLGSVMQIGGQPYHIVRDRHGDQIQLPCTERNLTDVQAVKVLDRGYMPVLSIKGRDEIRLGAFMSLAGGAVSGPWTAAAPPAPSPASAPVRSPGPGTENRADADQDTLLAGQQNNTDDGADADGIEGLSAFSAGSGDKTSGCATAADEDEEGMDPDLAALLASL